MMRRLAITALSALCLFAAYAISAGKLPTLSMVMMVTLIMVVTSVFGSGASSKEADDLQFAPLDSVLEARLQQRLKDHGLHGFVMLQDTSNVPSEYPIPFVMGKGLALTPNALESLGPAALDWITVAEARSEEFEPKLSTLGLVAFSVALGLLFGVSDRLGINNGWFFLILIGLIVTLPILWIGHLLRAQRKSDRIVTQTPSDFEAAKEALSYACFSQVGKRWSDKIPLLQRQSLGRAKSLGITLERGFRAIATDGK